MKKLICAAKEMQMKSVFLAVAFAFAACFSFAEQATLTTVHPGPASGCMSTYTPFKLTLVGPVALPWGSWDVYGLEIGVWNATDVMKGLQVGAVNVTDAFCGLQVGAVNVSRIGNGFQIGIVNVVSGKDHPFLPVINWAF